MRCGSPRRSRSSGRGCLALGAGAPIDDLGLVEVELGVVGRREAGSLADGAIDVDESIAGAAHEMVMVVADPIFVSRRRPRRLDPPDDVVLGEEGQGVVDRLPGNCPDVLSDDLGDVVRRAVRMGRNGTQHGEPLRRDLEAPVAENFCEIDGHERQSRTDFGLCQVLGPVHTWNGFAPAPRGATRSGNGGAGPVEYGQALARAGACLALGSPRGPPRPPRIAGARPQHPGCNPIAHAASLQDTNRDQEP